MHRSSLDGMFGVLPAQGHRILLHAPVGRVKFSSRPVFPGRHLVPLQRQRELLLPGSHLYARGKELTNDPRPYPFPLQWTAIKLRAESVRQNGFGPQLILVLPSCQTTTRLIRLAELTDFFNRSS